MSDYKVTDTELTSVANAIRTRGGTQAQLEWASGFANAIGSIGNSYAAGDEGKVVSSGALVVQSSQNITENGTYDTTLKNEVVVAVSGGGGSGGSGGGAYKQLTPLHTDVNNGYISGSSFYYEPNGVTYCDIYEIEAGKKYVINLGGTVGSRFRVATFHSDPALATGNLSGGNGLDETAQAYALAGYKPNSSSRCLYSYSSSPAQDKYYLTIAKTNASVTGIKTYVAEFDESASIY